MAIHTMFSYGHHHEHKKGYMFQLQEDVVWTTSEAFLKAPLNQLSAAWFISTRRRGGCWVPTTGSANICRGSSRRSEWLVISGGILINNEARAGVSYVVMCWSMCEADVPKHTYTLRSTLY